MSMSAHPRTPTSADSSPNNTISLAEEMRLLREQLQAITAENEQLEAELEGSEDDVEEEEDSGCDNEIDHGLSTECVQREGQDVVAVADQFSSGIRPMGNDETDSEQEDYGEFSDDDDDGNVGGGGPTMNGMVHEGAQDGDADTPTALPHTPTRVSTAAAAARINIVPPVLDQDNSYSQQELQKKSSHVEREVPLTATSSSSTGNFASSETDSNTKQGTVPVVKSLTSSEQHVVIEALVRQHQAELAQVKRGYEVRATQQDRIIAELKNEVVLCQAALEEEMAKTVELCNIVQAYQEERLVGSTATAACDNKQVSRKEKRRTTVDEPPLPCSNQRGGLPIAAPRASFKGEPPEPDHEAWDHGGSPSPAADDIYDDFQHVQNAEEVLNATRDHLKTAIQRYKRVKVAVEAAKQKNEALIRRRIDDKRDEAVRNVTGVDAFVAAGAQQTRGPEYTVAPMPAQLKKTKSKKRQASTVAVAQKGGTTPSFMSHTTRTVASERSVSSASRSGKTSNIQQSSVPGTRKSVADRSMGRSPSPATTASSASPARQSYATMHDARRQYVGPSVSQTAAPHPTQQQPNRVMKREPLGQGSTNSVNIVSNPSHTGVSKTEVRIPSSVRPSPVPVSTADHTDPYSMVMSGLPTQNRGKASTKNVTAAPHRVASSATDSAPSAEERLTRAFSLLRDVMGGTGYTLDAASSQRRQPGSKKHRR